MDELDRLPHMTPGDERDLPPLGHRRGWPLSMTLQTGMILSGVLFILVCGFRPFVVAGQAMTLVDPSHEEGSAYWAEVLPRLYKLAADVCRSPEFFGLGLGVALVVLGVFRTEKPRVKTDEPEL
jgi:hypothetical protein